MTRPRQQSEGYRVTLYHLLGHSHSQFELHLLLKIFEFHSVRHHRLQLGSVRFDQRPVTARLRLPESKAVVLRGRDVFKAIFAWLCRVLRILKISKSCVSDVPLSIASSSRLGKPSGLGGKG